MQQQSSANQKRDQNQEGGRRRRNKMSKLEQVSRPPPSPSVSGDDEDSLSASDDEIVISATTKKFDIKKCERIKMGVRSSSQRTECDDDHGDRTESASENEDLQDSQLTETSSEPVTTTLSPSPSPTPQPFQEPSPPPSPTTAIDSTTTTTTTSTSTTSESPLRELDSEQTARRISFSSNHRHSVVTKLTKKQLEHLDLLIDSIKQGNFSEFSRLMGEKQRDCKQNLLNVFVDGNTALHYSLLYGRSLKWCKQLILSGANPDLANRDGWHPIHLAAYRCSSDILNYVTDCVAS